MAKFLEMGFTIHVGASHDVTAIIEVERSDDQRWVELRPILEQRGISLVRSVAGNAEVDALRVRNLTIDQFDESLKKWLPLALICKSSFWLRSGHV